MRIVVAHNRYRYSGGEDAVLRAEVEMLRDAGHVVELFEADNKTIEGTLAKIGAAGSLFHSSSYSQKMTELLRAFRPEILHVHNWFPLLSPSIISAACEEGVPVVQTLHNFRMLCVNGTLYRDGRICHDCLGKRFPLNGAINGCYSNSRIGSALIATAFTYHRMVHTWDGVTTFIAVSEYQKALLIRGGVDADKITVKPNFVKRTNELGSGGGGYALFVGRLTAAKGIRTVLRAWSENRISTPLRIMGDGPLVDEVRETVLNFPQVQYLGQKSPAEVYAAMADARFVICSSECPETFGLTAIEALSRGTPVLAADTASVRELIEDGQNGLCFTPGDPDDLAAKASVLVADDATYQEMRRNCRAVYEKRYTDSVNYKLLMDIYQRAIDLSSCTPPAESSCLSSVPPG
jgi:glycosyltransferase involved in cell wall biosynthesis